MRVIESEFKTRDIYCVCPIRTICVSYRDTVCVSYKDNMCVI